MRRLTWQILEPKPSKTLAMLDHNRLNLGIGQQLEQLRPVSIQSGTDLAHHSAYVPDPMAPGGDQSWWVNLSERWRRRSARRL